MARVLVHKEMRELVRDIVAMGYTVERGNGNHHKVYSRTGNFVYSLPSSPGRGRWRKNLTAELRKHMDSHE